LKIQTGQIIERFKRNLNRAHGASPKADIRRNAKHWSNPAVT
jgi:hypothetical protein